MKDTITELKGMIYKSRSPKMDNSHEINLNDLDRLLTKVMIKHDEIEKQNKNKIVYSIEEHDELLTDRIKDQEKIYELEKLNEKLIMFAIDYYLILGFMGNTENIRTMLAHEIEKIKQKPIEEILKEM